MALGREDGAVAVADGGADVAGLAGLLGDDEGLHAGPGPSASVGADYRDGNGKGTRRLRGTVGPAPADHERPGAEIPAKHQQALIEVP